MAISFFKKKPKEEEPENLFPPLPPDLQTIPTELPSPFGEQPSTDELARAETFGMKPAAPVQRPIPPAPLYRPPTQVAPAPKPSIAEIEEIAEAIIAEKWQKVSKELDELRKAQEDTSASVSGVQERLTNVEKKIDMVIQEVLGKVEEYGKGIQDVGVELKAMQKVFGTVMPTFTENIKELQDLVGVAKAKGIGKKKR